MTSNSIQTGTPAHIVASIAKIQTGISEVNGKVFERQTEVHGGALALTSGNHLLLVGKGGVAKSYLIRLLTSLVNTTRVWSKQMHPEISTRDVIGYLNIPKFATEGVYEYNTSTSIQSALLAHVREATTAPTGVIITLADILNEGVGQIGDQKFTTRLTAFLDCNALPDVANIDQLSKDQATVAAVMSRIALRCQVRDEFFNRANRRAMHRLSRQLRGETSVTPSTQLEEAELEALQRYVLEQASQVPDGVLDTLFDVVDQLRRAGIYIDNRRENMVDSILVADALLQGKAQPDEQNIRRTFRYWSWLTTEQIPIAIGRAMKEEAAAAQAVQTFFSGEYENPKQKIEAAIETQGKVRDVIQSLEDMAAKHPEDAEEILDYRAKCTGYNKLLRKVTMPDVSSQGSTTPGAN